MTRPTLAPAVIAAIMALGLAACGTAAPATSSTDTAAPSAAPAGAPAAVKITIVTDPATIGAYTPQSATAKVGDVVEWDFIDLNPHTVSSDGNTPSGTFDSGTQSAGKSFRFTFTAAGTYAYHCNIHPGMHGQVVVS